MKDKQELKEAYEAGFASVELNKKRSDLLEMGTKSICEEYSFEQWYSSRELIKTLATPFNVKGKRCPNGCVEYFKNVEYTECISCKSTLLVY